MRRAFTLLEMTVVLAVIALLTHLAVRELGQYRDMKLAKAADRQLEEIRDAAARFLSDVGRLPKPVPGTNGTGKVTWTLSELWKKPANLGHCRLVTKDGVSLAVGWRGPYLKMPFGRDRLLDPWGNPIELEDSARLRRLWTGKNGFVTNVCHYGPTGQAPGLRNMSLVPAGGLSADLVVTLDAGGYSGDIECSWYGAYENSVTNVSLRSASAGSQIVFRDVPCGEKILKITAGRTVSRLVRVEGPVTQIGVKVQ